MDEVIEKQLVPNIESYNKTTALAEMLQQTQKELETLIPDKLKKEAIEHFAKLACMHAVEEANGWQITADPFYQIFMGNDVAGVKAMFEKAIALAEQKKFSEGAEFLVQSLPEMERLTEFRFAGFEEEICKGKTRVKLEREEVIKVVTSMLENDLDCFKRDAEREWNLPGPFFNFRATGDQSPWRCVRIAGGDWHIVSVIWGAWRFGGQSNVSNPCNYLHRTMQPEDDDSDAEKQIKQM